MVVIGFVVVDEVGLVIFSATFSVFVVFVVVTVSLVDCGFCPRRNTIPTRTIIRGGWVSSSSSSSSLSLSTLLKMG